MLSLQQLFGSVDDFCQGFEVQWQQQLLSCGLKLRNRPRSLTKERDREDSDCIPLIVLPQLQNLLSTEGAD